MEKPLGEDKVELTMRTPVPNKGRDPLVVEMRVKSGFEADKSQFVGIWKIHGEDMLSSRKTESQCDNAVTGKQK